MKILWISSWFGDYRVPVYDNLNRLSDGGFYLICSQLETSKLVQGKLKETLGDHADILERQKIFRIGKSKSDFANSTLEIRWQKGLYSAISKVKPDIIIVEGFGRWAPAGIIYSLLHHKKLLMFYERTAWTERNAGFLRTLYRKIAGKAVHTFLSNGILSEQYLRSNLGFKQTPIIKGCMSADSFYLHHDDIEQQSAANSSGISEREKHSLALSFLFIGRIVERKGILQLLEAWTSHHQSYPDDTLTVIGEGPLLDAIKQRYDTKSGVKIMDYVAYNDIYTYYNMCDVVVMPTLEDNWSLVIPEAMSCRKPVMCSIYNGCHPELVKDDVNGYTFDPLNKQEFVDTFAKFHSADLNEMGTQGMLIEKNFSPEKSSLRIFNACKKAYEDRL